LAARKVAKKGSIDSRFMGASVELWLSRPFAVLYLRGKAQQLAPCEIALKKNKERTRMKPATLGRWLRDPFAPVLLLAAGLCSYKVWFAEVEGESLFNCATCLAGPSVLHEMEFLLVLLVLHWFSLLLRNRALTALVRLASVAAIAVQFLDLVALNEFLRRLTLEELLVFSAEPRQVYEFLHHVAAPKLGLALALALLLAACAARYVIGRPQASPSVRRPLIGLLACIPLVAVGHAELGAAPSYHEAYLRNSLEAFFDETSRETPYSHPFAQAVPPGARTRCDAGLGARPNVVLVIVESLSPYQSRLASGLNDWTPRLDALAGSALRVGSFRANGVSSEEGLVALLTGEPPIPKPVPQAHILEQFKAPAQSVPRFLDAQGYRSEFLTTGNLGFMDKGAWLDAIGFDLREGHDAPAYKGMKRHNFDAAPDSALYDRALQELAHAGSQPLFLALETVSSHLPYEQPETGERTEESVFRYTDAQLDRFVTQLRARGFFENGVVLVTGDHRAMVPMSGGELARFGDRAYAMVPMIAIGMGLHGEVPGTFSQTDLLPSLEHWIGQGEHCIAANQGVFLPKPLKAPACIFTRRPYDPDLVAAECGTHDLHVNLDGDETGFEGEQVGSAELLASINRLRLGRGF
jgi:lipoteichoic acid synthase